ncbi:MAG: metal-dependent transcriptional regulator [Chitinophagaceae bacterium]|nr:metal-dependent transcriptional regulator [Chitinophagaceae bacterium]
MLSFTEENYLKALMQITLGIKEKDTVGTNELATHLAVKPATANDMLKKLKEKKLVDYKKYGKISLTPKGKQHAIETIRRHRLWETFLYEKLEFTWDEVHEVAEQLEHIQSTKLIDKLDKFLNYPQIDPHGDIIPDANGQFRIQFKYTLADIGIDKKCKMVAVKDNSKNFLQYVEKLQLNINSKIKVIAIEEYDGLISIEVNKKKFAVSKQFAENIFVVCEQCIVGKVCATKTCGFVKN